MDIRNAERDVDARREIAKLCLSGVIASRTPQYAVTVS